MNDFTASNGTEDDWEPAQGHSGYRSGHVDGVHCAGSTDCHWRGATVDEWLAHAANPSVEVAS